MKNMMLVALFVLPALVFAKSDESKSLGKPVRKPAQKDSRFTPCTAEQIEIQLSAYARAGGTAVLNATELMYRPARETADPKIVKKLGVDGFIAVEVFTRGIDDGFALTHAYFQKSDCKMLTPAFTENNALDLVVLQKVQ